MISWRDVRVLWGREVRGALRERAVLLNGVLLPLILYPLLLWVAISALGFVSGRSERTPSRVEVSGAEQAYAEIVAALESAPDSSVRLVQRRAGLPVAVSGVTAGDTDVVVEVGAPDPALPAGLEVLVHYDRSRTASRQALGRVEAALHELRDQRLEEAAADLGLPGTIVRPVRVEMVNVSSDQAVGATVLGLMIPLFLVISVALGCLVPAVDTTAGEHERGTWETLMTTPASRASVVTAKYLYVAVFGAVAGMLNVLALSLSLGPMMAPLQGIDETGVGLVVRLAPATLAIMAAGAVILALFFAAAMMPLAAFARTFKDGQALVTPVFYLALLPLLLGQQTDRTLTPALATIPVANVAMAVRDAIQGIFVWPLLAFTAMVNLVLVVGFLSFAVWMLDFEDLTLGTRTGTPWRMLRDRWSTR